MAHKEHKKGLHPRNPHNKRYDFPQLIKSLPKLADYVFKNKYDEVSIDFADAKAVMALNKALLAHFYNIKKWSIPEGYLCPPIPGRADYLHYIADILAEFNGAKVPKGSEIKGLDIGIGANCIYPIIGNSVYGWSFVGSDIEKESIESSQKIIESNDSLRGNVECRLQTNHDSIFTGIIKEDDRFDFTLCNPPFHKSQEEAQAGSKRKVQNLTKQVVNKASLNFGGKSNELWCKGGEVAFVKAMIKQSKKYAKNCFWFSTIVSKKDNLQFIYDTIDYVKPTEYDTIEMQHGQKISRIVIWTFLTKEEQKQWASKWKD
ncbi:rRNA (adenine-N(6)-)-methyltransferase [Arcobacter nitrofigilis DSM 7299]|uniref:rRNA (Adenine-N(6)-)-methyltransferase n=1 Tax=Arcobacter nitrofigilis (strain ATCC 33309 / DSM 7299 / CCUG 15893 / LMG 7604 / NCTC 12251 / CI) TaxID=572480 RepID=D5V625_ARCNC|nr:23S rRNA (adenine(1618)-N(6))-methyltransferase RlmF [Arcobacter nitrofigilis]ADG93192.1 rRNA (adenine-N(6)-)-methyltransferase [Arcobacter nitrofigilis DSM 7299]